MKIINNEENPVEKEVLAESIVKISDAITPLLKSGLNQRAIVALIWDRVKTVNKRDIVAVLEAISELKKLYTNK